MFALYEALSKGKSVERLHGLSGIDKWFLRHLSDITTLEAEIRKQPLNKDLLLRAKQAGFADRVIADLKGLREEAVRRKRLAAGIKPIIKQIDTLAGEFDASTNYLYMTYHGDSDDVKSLGSKAAVVIGSGPYCIGSSVEFDWCAVNTGKTLHAHGWQTVMVNSNPETVSTDFDHSDRLYFEELTLERLRDIADFERPHGIVVSVGGQIANNLALPLAMTGYPVMGTPPRQIDRAEDRQKFSDMLGKMGVDQPAWEEVTTLAKAKAFAKRVGYPVIIRPSYVLSGGAMNVVSNEAELSRYMSEAADLSPDHPVVISQFITNSKEIEIDGVAMHGKLVIYAISEHIENAGVHSGDATVVFPAQRLYLETVRRAKLITRQIIRNLD
ncbi:MAG: ATP-grasp domain-containing protein, partial [Candidatus Saccharimonadales bacterium]